MRKFVLVWGLVSIVVFTSLVLVIFNVRYIYNFSGDAITLMQYDKNLSASVILSLLFVSIGYLFIVVSIWKNKNRMSDFLLRTSFILSIYPILRGLLFFLFDVFRTEDKFYYFSLGSKFIVNHPELYSNRLSFDEIANIGEHLRFGIASYMLLILFILMLLNQIVFMTIYIKKIKNII